MPPISEKEILQLSHLIKQWGKELGFAEVGISDIDLNQHEAALEAWLAQGYHGNMEYMARHGMMRARPDELQPGAVRAICVRMDYLPEDARFASDLDNPHIAYISRYAVGRDYHKIMRKRLQQLGARIQQHCEQLEFRPFVDSAPILERPLAEKAGLGWVGKHTLLLNKDAGSWFFLGELLINVPLPVDEVPEQGDCGKCVACLKICPTQAIVAPYVVDARRCISYLTIEHSGSIPEELRSAMGNRIYGCDDCQLICPWNRYAPLSEEPDFQFKSHWQDRRLLTLWQWSEAEFLNYTAGSPIRRIGYIQWLRNLAIALGNAQVDPKNINALQQRLHQHGELVDEHIEWAIAQQQAKLERNQRLTQRLIRSVRQGLPRDAD